MAILCAHINVSSRRDDLRLLSSLSPFVSSQLFGDALSRYAEDCPQAVEQASLLAKAEVTVLWTAPPAGNAGCVNFK